MGSSSLASGFVLTVSTNFWMRGLNILTGVILARSLGPGGRGEWEAMRLWPITLATLGSLGLDHALIYFVSKKPERGASYFSTYCLLSGLLALIWIPLIYFIMPYLLKNRTAEIIANARWFLLSVPLLFFIQGVASTLCARKDYFWWNIIRQEGPLFSMIGLVCLWIAGNVTSVTVLQMFFVTILIRTTTALTTLIRREGKSFIAKGDREIIGQMIIYGAQSSLGSMPYMVNLEGDQLIIAGMLSTVSLGLYITSVSWSNLAGLLVDGLARVIFPRIAGSAESDDAGRAIVQSARFGMLFSTVSGVVLTAAAPWCIPLIFGGDFAAAVPVAMLLSLAGIPRALGDILKSGLRGLGIPTAIAWAEGVGLLMTFGLLYVLLPRYGIFGAAVASIMTYSVVLAMLVYYTSRCIKLPSYNIIIPTRSEFIKIWQYTRRIKNN